MKNVGEYGTLPDFYFAVDRSVQLSCEVPLKYFKDAFQYRRIGIGIMISRSKKLR